MQVYRLQISVLSFSFGQIYLDFYSRILNIQSAALIQTCCTHTQFLPQNDLAAKRKTCIGTEAAPCRLQPAVCKHTQNKEVFG